MIFIEWMIAQWAKLIAWTYDGMTDDEKEEAEPDMKKALDWCRKEQLPKASVEIRKALDDTPD